jgi:iron complex transport system permease protein
MKHTRIWPWFLLIPPILALGVLTGPHGVSLPEWDTPMGLALLRLRAYRVIAGFVVGAALAGAGVVLQAVLRNPLADPYVLGVSSGSALGAALVISFGLAGRYVFALPLGAFVAALLTLMVVFRLAARNGVLSVYGLILSGVVVSSMLSSLLMLLMTFADNEGLHSIFWWMLGSLQAHSGRVLAGCSICAGVALAVTMTLTRELNALTLGREMAHHLGIRTRFVIGLALAAATLATAAAVALAGLIGFVGLIVPHAMRNLTGADHRRLLPASVLAGGALLVLCDTFARTLFAPLEIPVGVVTALAGGPFFLVLLRRRKPGWVE